MNIIEYLENKTNDVKNYIETKMHDNKKAIKRAVATVLTGATILASATACTTEGTPKETEASTTPSVEITSPVDTTTSVGTTPTETTEPVETAPVESQEPQEMTELKGVIFEQIKQNNLSVEYIDEDSELYSISVEPILENGKLTNKQKVKLYFDDSYGRNSVDLIAALPVEEFKKLFQECNDYEFIEDGYTDFISMNVKIPNFEDMSKKIIDSIIENGVVLSSEFVEKESENAYMNSTQENYSELNGEKTIVLDGSEFENLSNIEKVETSIKNILIENGVIDSDGEVDLRGIYLEQMSTAEWNNTHSNGNKPFVIDDIELGTEKKNILTYNIGYKKNRNEKGTINTSLDIIISNNLYDSIIEELGKEKFISLMRGGEYFLDFAQMNLDMMTSLLKSTNKKLENDPNNAELLAQKKHYEDQLQTIQKDMSDNGIYGQLASAGLEILNEKANIVYSEQPASDSQLSLTREVHPFEIA